MISLSDVLTLPIVFLIYVVTVLISPVVFVTRFEVYKNYVRNDHLDKVAKALETKIIDKLDIIENGIKLDVLERENQDLKEKLKSNNSEK